MPQITHRDLVSFADDKVNLKQTEVDMVRRLVDFTNLYPWEWQSADLSAMRSPRPG